MKPFRKPEQPRTPACDTELRTALSDPRDWHDECQDIITLQQETDLSMRQRSRSAQSIRGDVAPWVPRRSF